MIFPGTKAALAAAKAPCEANSLPPPHTTMRDPLLLAGVSTLLLAATALACLYPPGAQRPSTPCNPYASSSQPHLEKG
jgi:hypothetical protein